VVCISFDFYPRFLMGAGDGLEWGSVFARTFES
jgi:hypothetical protein